MGKRKRPFYRLVAVDSRRRRDGDYLANLGYYNPFIEPHEVRLHDEEILTWMRRGAVVSETARSLFKAQGILLRFSLEKQGVAAEEVSRRVAEVRAGADRRAQDQAEARAQQRREQAESVARARAEAQAAKAAAAAAEAAAAQAAQSGESAGEAEPAAEG